MTLSHKKYVDPSEVLDSVVDETGQPVTVGNQRDLTEYHLNFLSRIEDAFYYQEKYLEAMQGDINAKPIQLKDLPESFSTSATLRNQLQGEALSVPENSVITNHFFGKMKQIMTFTQNDEQTTEEKDLILGPIILDVLNKDLYTALETYCNFTLEDYQTPAGEVTVAKGQIWITKPPELLFVQLNRVSYDTNTKAPVKINKAFEFDKEIYLDRFLLSCKDEAYLINKRIVSLRAELDQKEYALQKLMSSFDSKTDIVQVLDFMENFLKRQKTPDLSALVESDPTVVGALEEEEKLDVATGVISAYKLHFENKVAELKSSIATTKETINKLWSKLNKRKYHLVSILIHEGDAESGHYYSFNRNIQRDTWTKFNDHHVSEEKEETVLTEALGGYANMNAYCLVYLSDENVQEELNMNTTDLKDLFTVEEGEVEVEKSFYKKLLAPSLIQEVVAENIAFQDEVEDFQSNSFVKSIVDKYKSCYNTLIKAPQTDTAKFLPVHLNSFANFLKADSYCTNSLKWYLLDSMLQAPQDLTQTKNYPGLSLRTLQNYPQLYLKAQQQLKALPAPFTMPSLALTAQIENQLEIKLAEYASEYPIILYVRLAIKAFLRENWQEACYAIKQFLDVEKDERSYLFRLVRDCTKVACLFMALKAEQHMKKSQVIDCCNVLVFLIALVKGTLKADEVHCYQVRSIMFEFINESKTVNTKDATETLKQQYQQFMYSPHSIAELEKVTAGYQSENLQKMTASINQQELYSWKEKDEKTPANKLKKLVEKFRLNLQIIVQFHNHISKSKTVLNASERKSLGFVLV